ncbi:MAG: universal stress protein [Pricia sp.]
MTNRTYKILVLSDLNNATDKMLANTVRLAKIINGEIAIFNVKRPTEIVAIDNQLSAMRSINTEHSVIDKKLSKLIAPISKSQEVDITHSFAFGNVKDEISSYIKKHTPDIIVLGRRKYNPLSFVGDGITEFVLKTFDGPILIASDKYVMEPEEKMALGVLNGSARSLNLEFAEDLMANVLKPIKSFKFVKNSNAPKPTKLAKDGEITEYVFDYNDRAVSSLSKYISKNRVDLLYLGRGKKGSVDEKTLKLSDIWHIINAIKASVLVSGR